MTTPAGPPPGGSTATAQSQALGITQERAREAQRLAEMRAREALGIAVGIVEPSAVRLRNGDLRLSSSRDVLPAQVVSALESRLILRARDRARDERLLAEAVAVLGAEIARTRDQEPADGATSALDRLLHVPNLSAERRDEGDALLRTVLQNAAQHSEPAAARLAALPGEPRPPLPSELTAAAHQITRESRLLTNALPAASSAALPGAGGPAGGRHSGTALPGAGGPGGGRRRGQVGARHRRVRGGVTATPQVRGTGLVVGVGGRPVLDGDLAEDTALAALRQLGRADLSSAITSRPTINAQQLAVISTTTSSDPQYIRVEILPVDRGMAAQGRLRSGTENDPHVLRISPRVADSQLARIWVHQLSQLTQQLEAAKAGRPHGVMGRLGSLFGHEKRDRTLNADHAAYRLLTKTWHQARTQTAQYGRPTGAQSVADLERDLQGLAAAIGKKAGTPPALPWDPAAIYVPGASAAGVAAAVAVQAAANAEPEPNTPAFLREQVVAEIAGLESAVTDLQTHANAKTESSATATEKAAEKLAEAATEEKFNDKGAPERARKLRVEADGESRKASRHTEIAAAYTKAADGAGQALAGYQELLAELDAVIADPSRPQTAIPDLAREAAEKADAYQVSVDRALPVKDLLSTGVPTGDPLAAPVDEINRVLTAHGIGAALGASGEPLPLPAAEYRRVLSTSGMEFTVGGNPDDDVTKLVQVRLKLKPRDVREVTSHDYDLAEQMQGTIGEGGQNVATTDTHLSNVTVGIDAQPLMAMAPPGSTVHSLSQVVSPRVDATSGRSMSETAGASGHYQRGSVDDNRGESLLVEWSGDWEIEVRKSATEPWSAVETADAGQQLTWVSAAYTVKPAAETTTLADHGRQAEISTAFPRHTVSDIADLTALRDSLVAEGRDRFGSIDRVAYDHLDGLMTKDINRLLREMSKPGGYGRQIVSGGEAQYHLQLEVEPIWSTAELSGEASSDLWQEEVLVDFAGVTASQTFASSLAASASLAYPGKAVAGQPVPGYLPSPTALSDVGHSTADISPSISAGRNVSRQGGLNVSATSITPAVHRDLGPTQGVLVGLKIKATLRKLGDTKTEPVVVEEVCQARLRVAENDLFRCGGPVDKDAVLRNADDTPRLDQDNRILLRGDAEPATGPQTLPPWIGRGENQLRGAGQALPQDLTGAERALADTLTNLSAQGLVPPLDADFQPRFDTSPLPADPVRRARLQLKLAGQLINYDRVVQQISAGRLEAGYNQACQSGIPVMLVDRWTGQTPRYRPIRVAISQDFDSVEGRGTSTTTAVVRLGIASDATGRSGGRSKSVPVSGGVNVSNGPAQGMRGWAGRLGVKLSRNAIGRTFGWTVGRRVNRVSLTESTGPVDELRVGHRIVVTEITPTGDSAPLAEVAGSARIVADSALTRADAPVYAAQPTTPDPAAVQQSMPVHVDAGNPVDRIHTALNRVQPGSSAYLELHALLAPDSLVAHTDWMNGEYRLPLTVTPAPNTPAAAVRQGTLLPRELSVVVRGEAKSLTFAAVTDQNTADINLTIKDTGFSSGRSASGGVGIDGGAGPVDADGSGTSGGVSAGRIGGTSQSTTDSQSTGDERLLVNIGVHYQFIGRFGMAAEIKDGNDTVQAVPLQDSLAQLSMPERRALRLYGKDKLDLPLGIVADAAERYLEGQLELSPRDAHAFVRRYKKEKAGQTTGLAASHTDERLTAKVLETAGVPAPTATTAEERLDEALVATKQNAEQQRAVGLPDPYDAGLASAQIEDINPVGRPDERLDLLTPVVGQIEEVAPGLLDENPLVRDALAVDLADTAWDGHLGDMLGVRGFPLEVEVPVPGRAQPDLLLIRIKARYDGRILVDGSPQLPKVDAVGLNQGYGFVARRRSVSHNTVHSAGVELKGPAAAGATLSGAAGTDRSQQVSAEQGDTNTTIDRTGHFDLAQVERGLVFTTEVSRVHNAGAATMASLRWKLNRTVPAEQTTDATAVQLHARLALLVPRQLIDPAPQNAAARTPVAQPVEHRGLIMPDGVVAEAMLPHGKDEPPSDQLYTQLAAYLAQHKQMREAGFREYQVALETVLAPTALRAAFKRLTSEQGLRLPPMAGRGNGSTTFSVVIKAKPLGWDLQGEPLPDAQAGWARRREAATSTSNTRNHLLPVTGTGGVSSIVNVGGSIGEQVKEKTSDAHGSRAETTKFEEGNLAAVEVPMVYQVTVEESTDTGRGTPKTKHVEHLPETAHAVYYLKMLNHEYLDGLRQLETGASVADPQLEAAPRKLGKPDLHATEYRQDASGKQVHEPYRPLLAALAQARAEETTVVLSVQEADGHERVYQAFANGTMAGVNDGGYGAAFATLHPRLALMAEGRVDLRELFNNSSRSASFSETVAGALAKNGVPDSILRGLDHATTSRQLAAGQGARPTPGGRALPGRAITPTGQGPSLSGP